jgi:hypothetical protein
MFKKQDAVKHSLYTINICIYLYILNTYIGMYATYKMITNFSEKQKS